MTLDELLDKLQRLKARDPEMGQRRVVIETAVGGVPHRQMVEVTSAQPGFDWTRPYFVLRGDEGLAPVKVVHVGDAARERLAELKDRKRSLFQFDLDEPSWLDGFKHGARQWITGEAPGD